MTRRGVLYLALALAAIADVASRAMVPATVVDLSDLVVLVGYGWGFVALKAIVVAGIVGWAEILRRVDGIRATAAFVPVVAIGYWSFGAFTNISWLLA